MTFALLLLVSLAHADEKPIYVDRNVTPPVLLKQVNARLPELKGIYLPSKFLMLEAVITSKGEVTNIKLLRCAHALIDKAVAESMKQWKFKPALKNGKAIAVYLTFASTIHIRY